MRVVLSAGLVGFVLVASAGCGGGGGASGDLVPVAGNITVDGASAGNVELKFVPQGDTAGNGGGARTDSTGHYDAMTTRDQKKGLPPGKYKVVASRRLNPDGSPPDPNTPPIESNAVETLPPKYSDLARTELFLTISPDDKRSFDFALHSIKKK